MAGYNGYSMSNNAVAAYDGGLVPASKIRGVPAALVKKFCRAAEWHHTSAKYNKTEFFDPAVVRSTFGLEVSNDTEVNPAAVAALTAGKAQAKLKDLITIPHCHLSWYEWTGTGRHKSKNLVTASGTATISADGAWVTIDGPDGRFKKRCDGNWMEKLRLPVAITKAINVEAYGNPLRNLVKPVAEAVRLILKLHSAGTLPVVKTTPEKEAALLAAYAKAVVAWHAAEKAKECRLITKLVAKQEAAKAKAIGAAQKRAAKIIAEDLKADGIKLAKDQIAAAAAEAISRRRHTWDESYHEEDRFTFRVKDAIRKIKVSLS